MLDLTLRRMKREKLLANQCVAALAGLTDQAKVDCARMMPECRTRAFVELAMTLSRRGDLKESKSWARTAIAVADQCPEPFGTELVPLAWANLGNVHRLSGEFRKSSSMFRMARDLWDDITDPIDAARVNSLEASLHREVRDFDKAIGLLHSAIDNVKSLASERFLATLEVQLGLTLSDRGDRLEASGVLSSAILKIDMQADPMLLLVAAHNLANCAAEEGRYSAAMRLLHSLGPDYEAHGTTKLRLQRDWLIGRITASRGFPDEACSIYSKVSLRSLEEGLSYQAGLVELDRAGALLSLEKFDEASEAAASAATVLEAAGSMKEALAAILLLRNGIARQLAPTDLLILLRTARRRVELR